ncbi:MAG TPA: prepilin-type N-terminal cleavage/methylation domain-containing protein [Gammaproteobacteria bacterium]|nr:prepilin-type N-terminal cleavage/methylation domain-containing protein [Gammaproteobacteria bacterium]
MAPIIKTGKRRSGFTLVELLVVLTVVALLAALVTPVVSTSVHRAREAVLKENLYSLRKAIDDFRADTGRYPQTLEQLVEKHYIRKVPLDPVTDRHDSWIQIPADAESGGGIIDVKSGAEGASLDGQSYGDW